MSGKSRTAARRAALVGVYASWNDRLKAKSYRGAPKRSTGRVAEQEAVGLDWLQRRGKRQHTPTPGTPQED